MTEEVAAFYDAVTGTISYVVSSPEQAQCIVIDPVLDFDPNTRRWSSQSANRIRDYVLRNGLAVEWLLETHVHADHLSAASFLRSELGGRIAIGSMIGSVQETVAQTWNLDFEFARDGSQFDHLLSDGDELLIGSMRVRAIAVPGHTPADLAYEIGGSTFVGDTLFMPDVGTARCDFPGGNAHELFRSIKKILDLPEDTLLYACHDYPPPGRTPRWLSTVREQRQCNIHVREGVSEEEFVMMRTCRDASLSKPDLLVASTLVNLRAISVDDASKIIVPAVS